MHSSPVRLLKPPSPLFARLCFKNDPVYFVQHFNNMPKVKTVKLELNFQERCSILLVRSDNQEDHSVCQHLRNTNNKEVLEMITDKKESFC